MAESIPVWMGSFQGRSTICNKRGRIETAGGGWVFRADSLHDGDMIPYGDFDPLNARFVCDTYYNVNFGFFKYKDIYYDGYITVSTLSEGLYQYSFTIDPISTCWDNGCFDCLNYVEFADRKDGFVSGYSSQIDYTTLPDPRLPFVSVMNNQFFDLPNAEITADSYVVMVTKNPILGTDDVFDGNDADPGDQIYIVTQKAYWAFYANLMKDSFLNPGGTPETGYNDVTQRCVSQSIKRTYFVPKYVFNDLNSSGSLLETSVIALRFAYEPEFLGITGDLQIKELQIPIQSGETIDANSKAFVVKHTPTYNMPSHTVDLNIPSTDMKYAINGSVEIFQPFIGSVSFTPSEIGITSLVSVGFRNKYNLTGGTNEMHIVVNGVDQYDYKTTGTISSEMPLVIFGDKQSPDMNGTNLGNAMGDLFASPLLSKGQAASAAAGSVLSAGVGLAATFAQAAHAATPNTFCAGKGLGGGAMWINGTNKSFVRLGYTKNTYSDDFRKMYGVPIYGMANLSTIANSTYYSGYCKTKDCHLKMKQLPYSIVSSAEAQCDQGVYLGMGPVD